MNYKQLFFSFILSYFKLCAQIQLKKIKPKIIGITGSAGKTTTLEAVAAILESTHFKVKVSRKANSETGIPLNILGLTPETLALFEWIKLILLCPIQLLTNWEHYDIYVVEMGIDSPYPPKNMGYLLEIVQPDIGVLLNATPTHSETFDHLVSSQDPVQRAQEITRLIAEEKGKIVTTLGSNKTAVVYNDQPEIVALLPKISAKTITFGTKNAAVIVQNYLLTKSGTQFEYTVLGKKMLLNFANKALPEHFALSFAAAISVGISLKIEPTVIAHSLETNFKLPPGRATLIEGMNNSLIIDSTYNASTKPTLDMLELLKTIPGDTKVALLADMREIGTVAQTEHEKVAQKASAVCNLVVLVGPLMQQFALPVIQKTKTEVHWFKNAYTAADYLKSKLKKNTVVLVKGSQNTLLLEIAVEQLMAHPDQTEKVLARRGVFWDKKRAELV